MKLFKFFFILISSINLCGQVLDKRSETEYGIKRVKYSPDGKTFAVTASAKNKEKFASGGKISTPQHKNSAYVNHNTEYEGPIISIFDSYSKSRIKRIKIPIEASDYIFSSDGKNLIFGGKNLNVTKDSTHYLYVLDLELQKVIKTVPAHKDEITSILLTHNGKQIITGSLDKTLKVWDIEKLQIQKSLNLNFNVLALSLNPNKTQVCAGGKGKYGFRMYDYVRDSAFNYSDISIDTKFLSCLEFSPKGDELLLGGANNFLISYNLKSKVATKIRLKNHLSNGGVISSVKFSSDGKYLFSGSEAGLNIFLYPRMICSYNNESEKVTSLDVDPAGNNLVVCTESEQMSTFYNITNLNINSTYKFKNLKDNLPPQILITNPTITSGNKPIIKKELIDIRGTVVDDYGVSELKINGITVPIKENGNFVMYLELMPGDNQVLIEATDLNGNSANKKFIILKKEQDVFDATVSRNYLLVIGVNDYLHWPKLNNAVKDANDVAKELIAHYTFDSVNTTILIDSNATKNNIIKTMRGLVTKVTPNDNLLIYFSGHGFFDELLNEGYWITREAGLGLEGDYLPNSTITKLLGNIDSRHTFLVADACFSGSLFTEKTRGYTENVEIVKSRWGLTSGRLEKVSDGTAGTNSPFAESFLSFLIQNNKGKSTVSELIQYVKVNVSEKSQQTPIGNPIKNIGDEGGEFVFYKRQ